MIYSAISLLTQLAQASSGGGHHDAGIPTVVWYQAINVAIFVGILVWFGKDKIRETFQGRLAEFNRLAEETANTKKDLEYKIADLKRRATQLRATSQQSLKDANVDAEKFYNEEIEKSKKAAQKIEKDVESQMTTDQQKLIEKLRIEVLEMSVAAAETQFRSLDATEEQQITQRVQKRIEGAVL